MYQFAPKAQNRNVLLKLQEKLQTKLPAFGRKKYAMLHAGLRL
jgi:hypothetical protein